MTVSVVLDSGHDDVQSDVLLWVEVVCQSCQCERLVDMRLEIHLHTNTNTKPDTKPDTKTDTKTDSVVERGK